MSLDDRQKGMLIAAVLAHLAALRPVAQRDRNIDLVVRIEFLVESLTSEHFPEIRDEILEWWESSQFFAKS